MNHWPQPLRTWHQPQTRPSRHLPLNAVRPEPLIFIPLALLVGLLLAPRAANAQEAQRPPTTFELTIEHHNEARVFVRRVEDTPLARDTTSLAPMLVTAPHSTRWAGWLSLGTGIAALGMGAALAVTAAQDGVTLQQNVQGNPLQYATAASQQQILDRAAALNRQLTLGAGVAVAGVAVAGVGTWLLLREPSRHTVVLPTSQGAQLTVAF